MTGEHSGAALTDRIVSDPAILGGKPVVRGRRIPVYLVLDYLAHNPSFVDLLADYSSSFARSSRNASSEGAGRSATT